jgi:YHS domain-containing protein
MSANKPNSPVANSTTGIGGYDAVAYFTEGMPTRGNGHHVTVFDGVTYLFASEENKKKFDANPKKHIPAYGGYCAFGVTEEKKFVGDPEAWKIVDGKLYLNLDTDIQGEWGKDVSGNIRKADSIWPRIKDTPPSDL